MRALILAVAAAAAAAIATLWWLGAGQVLLAWAVDSQRAAQNAMAAPLRALRAGDPSAVWALYGAAFLYGLFHAAGPGHGKLLIGGYGAARQVGALRLSLVALAASLAQGLAAILLVGAGLAVLGLGRQAMTDLAERLLQPLGYAAIAAIGLWLASRGVRSLLRRSPQPMPVGQVRHAPQCHTITFMPMNTARHAVIPTGPHPPTWPLPPPFVSFSS